MDDAQKQDQQNQIPQAQTPIQQPIAQPVSASPVKEAEPIPVKETVSVEYIKPSEPEPQLSEEVQQAGVQVSTSPVPADDKIGIKPSAEATPVVESKQNVIERIMSPQEVQVNIKKAPTESPRWLAELLKVVWIKLGKKPPHV